VQGIKLTDVLIIGGGLAGERCAIEAASRGLDVVLLSLVPPRRSHSCAAQGGMQAALGNCVKAEGDNPTVHFLDTVKRSDWGADQEVARLFADEAPEAVRELAHMGVPWTRGRPGNIDGEVVRLGVDVWDRAEALQLIHEGGRCWGAVVRSLRDGGVSAVLAKATIIATGGHGRIYGAYTTNAVINEGTGTALALQTGDVPVGNMEAVQFHPTGLVPSGILVTEGCRGNGGFLLDRDLHRFMVDAEPEKQELASRDVVSRHMEQRIRDGFGVEGAQGSHLWLDLRHLGNAHLSTKLREVQEICRGFLGIDPAKDLIPVRPTPHYSMGGIRVNKDGHAYGMKGLFAVGEASCWDLHGFNRLGGNSLAETIVAGRVVGRQVASFALRESLNVELQIASRFAADAEKCIQSWLDRRGGGPSVYEIRDAVAETMVHKVGVFRTGVADLRHQLGEVDRAQLRSFRPGANPELSFALRLRGMTQLALATAMGALARTESRGAHCRTDYPERDDAHWLNRSLVRWPDGASEPQLSYEPVGLLDLPPGDRGYGDTLRREMEISVETYNGAVEPEQRSQGAFPTEEPLGSRMNWRAWEGIDHKPTPDRSE
jgi:fumarate reductase flavoprotein subunit